MDWVFDMDGTLYSLVDEVWRQKVQEFVKYFAVRGISADWSEEEQSRLKQKWRTKQTLVAYIDEFNIDFDDIVRETHLPIVDDLPIRPRDGLELITSLPGRKWVLTNSPEPFAHAILNKLGINHVFNGVFGLRHNMRVSKPDSRSYLRVPVGSRVIMIDDWQENLVVPFKLGWKTIWFPEQDKPDQKLLPNHVHSKICSLEDLCMLI